MDSFSRTKWCAGSEVISTSVVVCAAGNGISRREEVRASCHSSDSSRVHNLPPDDRRDYFSRQMPSVERRVLRFRVRLGGIEGPLLFRIEYGNVGDRAPDERTAAAKIETASRTRGEKLHDAGKRD